MDIRTPLITVATVTYNSELFVKDAIESILCSSYENLELVIVDDNSSDSTWDLINQFTDARICRYRNEVNLGEYPNRNKAIDLAKGEYLIFIDGDDMVYPHGIEFLVRMLDAFPECGMALMRWYKKNIFYPVSITPEQLYTGIYFNYGFNDIAFANVLFRTSALKKAGGFPSNTVIGDNYMRLKIGRSSNTLLINDHLTFWRESPGQASSRVMETWRGLEQHFAMYFSFLQQSPMSDQMTATARQNLFISLAKVAARLVKKGDLRMALKLLQRFNAWPKALVCYFQKPVHKDPFEEWAPDRLFRLSLKSNPYCRENQHLGL